MSDIILKNGTFTRPPGAPYTVAFSAAQDLIFPFDGALIIPKPNENTSDFQMANTSEWIYHSLRYPLKGNGDTMVFPTLRTFDNTLFEIEGSVMIFVAQDHSLLDDIDFTNLFNSERYTPTFKENLSIASLPKYIIIKHNDAIDFPTGLPISKKKGIPLKNTTDPQLTAIKNALSSASFSGDIYAFDYAGHQTECAAALLNIGVDKAIANLPVATAIRVQFVDLHGRVIQDGDDRINALNFNPLLKNWDSTNLYYTINFTGDDRTWKIKQNAISGVTTDTHYLHKFIHLAFWPGYGFAFKALTTTTQEFDLAKDLEMPVAKAPTFLRICVFHPGKEFQTTAGGAINKDGLFKLTRPGVGSFNSFKLFHPDNKIAIFNDGQSFMKDLFKVITKEDPKRILKEIYLTNWKSSAHLHMNGSMTAYDIAANDDDVNAVDALLNAINANHTVVNFSGHDPAGSANTFLLLPARETDKAHITSSFWTECVTVTGAGESSKTQSKGFTRANALYNVTLTGNPALKTHQLKAYWKNSLNLVRTTTKTLNGLNPIIKTTEIPDDWFALEITDNDPPKALLKRKVALATISTALNLSGDTNAELLLLHQQRGSYDFIPLNAEGGDLNATNQDLSILEHYMANDKLIGLIVNRTDEDSQEFNATSILTAAKTFAYSRAAHLNANVPLHPEEFGGMIREAIANDVKVHALYWEQFLANVDAGAGVENGHSNNAEIAAILNRTVNNKRGFAILDRSTRPFGSFHQKATVLVFETEDDSNFKRKEMIAYLGGMDIAHGRWDTSEHHSKDPERDGNPWFDIQLKIEGQAVHDVLLNFKQRWEAIDEFIDTNNNTCRPVNPDAGISNAVNSGIKIETDPIKLKKVSGNTFLQINRTIPPFSCHAQINTADRDFVSEAGEDGSYQSYIKAIQNATKFILINEQYFFSVELALELHEALKKATGPKCLILVLPKDLSESEKIDPLLFKGRQKALQALYYGGNYTGPSTGAKCAHYTINPTSTTPHVKDKVVVLHPINSAGKDIYVHSKHIIVDDVFMMIGSSNINYRSMSYDWEINAACIGKKLFKGGTHNVRAHRIEICRILAGLPKAYTALLQDYYATFRLFKKIEREGEQPSTRLHPLKPRAKKLDPNYIKRITGDVQFNAGVDVVIDLDVNSPMLNFISCNVLDTDGRDTNGDQLGILATAAGAGKNDINAYALLSFGFDCETEIKTAITNGSTAFLEISMTIAHTDENDVVTTEGPFQTHCLELVIGAPLDAIVIKGIPTGEVTIPISTKDQVTITAQIDSTPTAIVCTAERLFNPAVDTVIPGTFLRETLTLNV